MALSGVDWQRALSLLYGLALPGDQVIDHEQSPNPRLNSDPACVAIRSLSTSRFLGSVQRLGAGVAG